jgi:DNA-binding transcriptional MerR regulator
MLDTDQQPYFNYGNGFLLSYEGFIKQNPDDLEIQDSFLTFLNKKSYPMRFIKFDQDVLSASRLIGTWIESGLIDTDVRDNKGAWKRFSLRDLIWIRIIIKLREFGFSIEKIKEVKHYLFKKSYQSRYARMFEFLVAQAMSKNRVGIVIFPNGIAYIGLEEQINDNMKHFDLHDFIHLDFNNIVQEVLPQEDLTPLSKTALELSKEEMQVIDLVRTGKYKSLQIVFKNGQIERLDATKKIDTNKRIGEIIKNEGGYQTLVIETNDGKMVSINGTVKVKV